MANSSSKVKKSGGGGGTRRKKWWKSVFHGRSSSYRRRRSETQESGISGAEHNDGGGGKQRSNGNGRHRPQAAPPPASPAGNNRSNFPLQYVTQPNSPGDRSHDVSVISTPSGLHSNAYAALDYSPSSARNGRGGGVNGTGRPLLPPMSEESKSGSGSSGGASRSRLLSPLRTASGRSIFRGGSHESSDSARSGGGRSHGSFLTRSKRFRKMSRNAFAMVDADNSGEVDKTELYAGLLLIHLNLAMYAGPAACKPATREVTDEIFEAYDADHSGTLDEDEFVEVMIVLCSQLLSRVAFQWTMTLMIVPLVAQRLIVSCSSLHRTAAEHWESHVEDEWGGQFVAEVREVAWDGLTRCWGTVSSHLPGFVPRYGEKVAELAGRGIDMVPDEVWKTLPLTLVTCVLTCLIVPWSLCKIDEFFKRVAERKRVAAERRARARAERERAKEEH